MVLWLAVSNDEYELPLIVEETGVELARKLGIKARSLYTMIDRGDFRLGVKLLKIKINEDIDVE